jgi:integrase
LLQVAESIKHEDRRRDAVLLVRLGITAGLRRSELAAARVENIYSREMRGGGTRWMLKVLGKGARWRPVPLTDDVVALLRQQLAAFDLPTDFAQVPPETPILARESDGGPLTDGAVAKRVNALLQLASDECARKGKIEDAGVFRRATAHWLRHTTGSLLGNANVPASQIQQLLGHASIGTTTIYTSTGEDEVYQSVNRVLGLEAAAGDAGGA